MFLYFFITYTLWVSIVLLLKNITSAQRMHAGVPQLRRIHRQKIRRV